MIDVHIASDIYMLIENIIRISGFEKPHSNEKAVAE